MSQKGAGDMRRRRRAAYCRGWTDRTVLGRRTIERLWAEGLLSPLVYKRLKAHLDAAPPGDTEPILSDEPGGDEPEPLDTTALYAAQAAIAFPPRKNR